MRKVVATFLLLMFPFSLFAAQVRQDGEFFHKSNAHAMARLANRAFNYQLRAGDMFEAATRLELTAARLKESGEDKIIERELRAHPQRFLAPTSERHLDRVQNRLAHAGLLIYREDVRKLIDSNTETKQRALTHIRKVGIYRALMEVASATRQAAIDNPERFNLSSYSEQIRLLPINRRFCGGMGEVTGLVGLIGSAMLLIPIPPVEAAGGVTLLFGALLGFGYFEFC